MKPLSLLIATALCFGPAAAPAQAADAVTLAKVVVALKPDKDPEQMLQERKSLQEYLSSKLGKPVEVIVPLSSAVIIEGFANGTIDLGYLSATDTINAKKANAADVLLAGQIDGKNSYRSYWVTLKEKPYQSIADLRGKPVAFASKTSTSAFVIPMWDLKQKGLVSKPNPEDFFGAGNIFYGSGYVSAIERVFAGQAEAAAVSYYVLDKDKHLTAEQRAKLRKLQDQGPVPTHVIAVRSSISAADKTLLENALLSLNEGDGTQLRDKLFTSQLVKANADEHLASLRDAIEFLGGK